MQGLWEFERKWNSWLGLADQQDLRAENKLRESLGCSSGASKSLRQENSISLYYISTPKKRPLRPIRAKAFLSRSRSWLHWSTNVTLIRFGSPRLPPISNFEEICSWKNVLCRIKEVIIVASFKRFPGGHQGINKTL